MTKPVVGTVVANIANDNAATCYSNDRMFAEALADLLDGDDDVTRATLLLNELRSRNVDMFQVNEYLAKGQAKDAEMAAQRLAAAKRENGKK